MTKIKVRVALLAGAVIALSACLEGTPMTKKGATPATAQSVLEGTVWQVEGVDNGGIINRSMITMGFTEGGRILGFTGCNRYFGNVTIAGDVLSLHGVGSTRRGCAPALMSQEQRFLNALNDSARFANEKDTWLVVYDAGGVERIRGTRVDADPTTAKPAPQDIGSGAPIVFYCGAKGEVSFRLVGPDAIELTVGDVMRVLTRKRTASGARYSGHGFEFWNKGDEALLTIGKERFSCKRR